MYVVWNVLNIYMFSRICSGTKKLPLNTWVTIQMDIKETEVTILIYETSDRTKELENTKQSITTNAVS